MRTKIIAFVGIFLISLMIIIPVTVFYVRFRGNIILPEPDKVGKIALEEAMLGVNQARGLLPEKELSLQMTGQLLWSMQGITHGQLRAAPSAGATYPLELYIYSYAVDMLEKGLYHYLVSSHELELISKEIPDQEEFKELFLPQAKTAAQAPLIIFVTAVFERTMRIYGERGYQYVQLEIGHVLGNLYLQAVTTNTHVEPIFQFNHSAIEEVVGLNEELEVIIPVTCCTPYQLVSLSKTQEEALFDEVVETNNLTVEQAISLRQSIRDYQLGEIPLSKMKRLLWYCWTNKTEEELLTMEVTCTSFTQIAAISLYLFAGDQITNLTAGIYQVDQQTMNLIVVKEGDFIFELYEAGLAQSWIRSAQSNLVFFLDQTELEGLPVENYWELGFLEIGMIAEFFYLEVRNLDLGMVVIGAFFDGGIRSIVGLDWTQKPTYIVPIGLSELSPLDGQLLQIGIFKLGEVFGYLSLASFYVCSFLATSPLKKRLKGKWLIIHHLSAAGFTLIFTLVHIFLIINIISFLATAQISQAIKEFVKRIIGYKLGPIDSLHKFGLLLSIIAFWLMVVMIGSSFLIYRFKLLKAQRRKILHQFLVGIILLMSFIHILANGMMGTVHFWLFIVLNALVIIIFFGLYFEPNIRRWLQKEEEIEEIEPHELNKETVPP